MIAESESKILMGTLEFIGKLFALQVKMLVPYAIAVMVLLK